MATHKTSNRSRNARLICVCVAILALAAIAAAAFGPVSSPALSDKAGMANPAPLEAEPPAPVEVTVTTNTTESRHPLDPAIEAAEEVLKHIRENVVDYTATMIKRERINDELQEHQFIFLKVRNHKEQNGEVTTPLSAYLKFLKPDWLKGREVIWVEGQNDGKLIAHETGFKNLFKLKLDPDGLIAMIGQRYPITNIGIEKLVEELIKRGERDRKHGKSIVNFYKDSKVDKRLCRMIEVIHPDPSEQFDFYRARICIDNELNVPIYYAAWSWPEERGGDPVLLEEYTYRDLKLNVGLTDADFDPDNPEYDYP